MLSFLLVSLLTLKFTRLYNGTPTVVPVEICGMIRYTYEMVIICHFLKAVQIMDQLNGIINVLFLSIYHQIIQLFIEYGVDVSNNYKYSNKLFLVHHDRKRVKK